LRLAAVLGGGPRRVVVGLVHRVALLCSCGTSGSASLLAVGAVSHSRNSTQAPHSVGPELADTLLSVFLVDTEAMLRTLQADGVSAAALTAAAQSLGLVEAPSGD
jgi:hypothetical protein